MFRSFLQGEPGVLRLHADGGYCHWLVVEIGDIQRHLGHAIRESGLKLDKVRRDFQPSHRSLVVHWDVEDLVKGRVHEHLPRECPLGRGSGDVHTERGAVTDINEVRGLGRG